MEHAWLADSDGSRWLSALKQAPAPVTLKPFMKLRAETARKARFASRLHQDPDLLFNLLLRSYAMHEVQLL